jgi:hypothetical protein
MIMGMSSDMVVDRPESSFHTRAKLSAGTVETLSAKNVV